MQFPLPTFDLPLINAKNAIIEELKSLLLDLNILALETCSVEKGVDNAKNSDQEKLKQLMKKKQKDTLSFLLEDEELNLEFSEISPYLVDRV